MANSGLAGPFPLDSDAISKYVSKESPGAYALGDMKHDGLFHIERVGRSDVDVADRLADHIGLYPQFKFGYFASPKAALRRNATCITISARQITTSIRIARTAPIGSARAAGFLVSFASVS